MHALCTMYYAGYKSGQIKGVCFNKDVCQHEGVKLPALHYYATHLWKQCCVNSVLVRLLISLSRL